MIKAVIIFTLTISASMLVPTLAAADTILDEITIRVINDDHMAIDTTEISLPEIPAEQNPERVNKEKKRSENADDRATQRANNAAQAASNAAGNASNAASNAAENANEAAANASSNANENAANAPGHNK